jgi:hypothetical protein
MDKRIYYKMNSKYLESAKRILLISSIPLSPKEIWKFIEETGYAKNINSKAENPESVLSSQLGLETKYDKSPIFGKIGENPIKYYIKK